MEFWKLPSEVQCQAFAETKEITRAASSAYQREILKRSA